MNDAEFNAFSRVALRSLASKQKIFEIEYNSGSIGRWNADLTREPVATLTFFDKSDKPALLCEVTEIGTFAPEARSWKWGWANDSLPLALRQRALPLKELAHIAGKDYFSRPEPFAADQDMALTLTAFAVQHLSALGHYAARLDHGRLYAFLVYIKIQVLSEEADSTMSGSQEHKAEQFMQHAQAANSAGHTTLAVDLQSEAWKRTRVLLASRPDDPAVIQKAGSVLYLLASFLSSEGRPQEALTILNDCEQHYLRLRGIMPQFDGWMADVTMARAVAQALSGQGSSAVIEAQSTVTRYRELLNRRGLVSLPDFARVLSTTADILTAFGDPELAAAAADAAISIYRQENEQVSGDQVHIQYWLRALTVSLTIAEAGERREVVSELKRAIKDVSGLNQTGSSPDTLINHTFALNTGRLTVTCATALDTAHRLLGHGRTSAALLDLFRNPRPQLALIPLDRPTPTIATVYAQHFAELGVDLLPLEPKAGLRLCLEAHYLFAGASKLQTLEMRYQLAEYGPAWGRALLASALHLESSGQLPLALDLASWSAGLAGRLMPFTFGRSELRNLIRDSVLRHAQLLIRSGHRIAGETELNAAARLSSEWGLDA